MIRIVYRYDVGDKNWKIAAFYRTLPDEDRLVELYNRPYRVETISTDIFD